MNIITALITPFDYNGIDYKSLEKIIKIQIDAGIDGIVFAGSTGEGLSLSNQEYEELLQFAVKIIGNQTNVIACVSSSHTNKAIELALIAQSAKVHAILATSPYYTRPSDNGLYEHFHLLHESTDIPIIIYSIPKRTGIDLSNDVVIRLSKLPRIIGLKDSSGFLDRPLFLRNSCPGFELFCGDDNVFMGFLAQGGNGLISVLSNAMPSVLKEIYRLANKNDYKSACSLYRQISPIINLLNLYGNPSVIKCIMYELTYCHNILRLPLKPTPSSIEQVIRSTMTANIDHFID